MHVMSCTCWQPSPVHTFGRQTAFSHPTGVPSILSAGCWPETAGLRQLVLTMALLWSCFAEYECKAGAAQRLAYPVVVAGGADSCTIHYLQNNKVRCTRPLLSRLQEQHRYGFPETLGLAQRVGAGELLLMDAGCELHGYSSDVTRTWPVSGTFSKHQREVYEIVLDTHRCAELLVPTEEERGLVEGTVQLPFLVALKGSAGMLRCVKLAIASSCMADELV